MATLLQLATRMRALSARLPTIADEAKKVVATAMLDSLLDNTPADTSTLVSNWQVGTGPISVVRPAYAEGKGGSTRETSIGAARGAGHAVIEAIAPGKPIVISNPVPYARYVNDGTSQHAPLLFVEKARLVGRLAGSAFKRSIGINRG